MNEQFRNNKVFGNLSNVFIQLCVHVNYFNPSFKLSKFYILFILQSNISKLLGIFSKLIILLNIHVNLIKFYGNFVMDIILLLETSNFKTDSGISGNCVI